MTINTAPAKRGMLSSCTGTRIRPKWSITIEANTCPAKIKPTVVAAPRRGITTMVASTYTAPSNPPTHAHQGAFASASPSGHDSRNANATTISASVPPKKEMVAATAGPPTKPRSTALMLNCTGKATPATNANNKRSQVTPFNLPIPPSFFRTRHQTVPSSVAQGEGQVLPVSLPGYTLL